MHPERIIQRPPTQRIALINRESSSSSSDKEREQIREKRNETKQRSPIYISDSANYSADEEELVIDHLDQIIASAEQQAHGPESYIITDPSMYNMSLAFDEDSPMKCKTNHRTKRNDCWTPMQDLSTSDESEAIDDADDDGIISGDTGSDEVSRLPEEITQPVDAGARISYVFDGSDRRQTLDIKDIPRGRGVDKNLIKRKVSSSSSSQNVYQGPSPYQKRINDVDATRFTLQNQIQTLLHHKLNNGKKIYS